MWLALGLLACDPGEQARQTLAEHHRAASDAAVEKGDFAIALAAAEAARAANPLDAALADAPVRVRLRELAAQPDPDPPSDAVMLDYMASSLVERSVPPIDAWLVARAHLALYRGDAPAAVGFAEEAMRANPRDPMPYLVKARVSDEVGAEAALRAALALAPTHEGVVRALAEQRLRVGDARGAVEALTPFVDTSRDANLLRVAGIARFSAGDARGAGAVLQRGVQFAPRDIEINRAQAEWYLAMGQLSEAETAYRRVVALGDSAGGNLGLTTLAERRAAVSRASEN